MRSSDRPGAKRAAFESGAGRAASARGARRASRWSGGCRAVLVLGAVLPLAALTQVPGPIRIGPSWGTINGTDHSVSLFTTLNNRGVLFDRLSGGSCPGYGTASLVGLDPATEGNRPQDHGLALAPGAVAAMTPGGPHIVLADAPASLTTGALVPCTVQFVHSGQRIVVFTIGTAPPPTVEP